MYKDLIRFKTRSENSKPLLMIAVIDMLFNSKYEQTLLFNIGERLFSSSCIKTVKKQLSSILLFVRAR